MQCLYLLAYFDLLTGEVYVQAQTMFDNDMYMQLLTIVQSAMRQTKITSDNFEAEYVSQIHELFLFLLFLLYFKFILLLLFVLTFFVNA